jgi:MoaA/NifB/PqqE/SkfB family radical SAM enzyme
MEQRTRELNLSLLRGERGQGRTRLSALPAEIQIEPTNRCLRKCPTCARNYYDKKANPPGNLTPALFERIAALFPYAERVLVGGYGEPLLADMTPAIIRRAYDAGCRTTLITGMGDLSEALAVRLARARLHEIYFSVDGADNLTLLHRRGYTVEDLRASTARVRAANAAIRVHFSVTLRRDNVDELPEIVALAGECKAKSVAVAHQKIYARKQADDSALADPERTLEAFARARATAVALKLRLELPALSGVQTCEQPYRMLAFRHDGVVQGCCSALFESRPLGLRLGQAPFDNPFDLWNSPPMLAARAFLQRREPPPDVCAACAFRVMTPEAHRRFLDGPGDA